MQNVNYTDDTEDNFYDWIQDLRISRNISFSFKEHVGEDFAPDFVVEGLGLNCNKSITIRSKSLGITNPSHGNVLLSNEIWAIKVGNGYLVTDPISFSF